MNISCISVAQAADLGPSKNAGAEVLFRCPRHDDKHPSLSINPKKNAWMCGPCDTRGNAWALAAFLIGSKPEDKQRVTAWLRDKGLLNGKSAANDRRIIATYDYVDEAGQLLFQVVRFDPKDFRQRRPDGAGGWIWDLNGIRRVPYRLPELLKAEYVHVVEGEKDVEALRKLGLCATCNPGGANKWPAEFACYFRSDQHVVLFRDNDEAGQRHQEQVAQSLFGKVATLKALEFNGLPEKGDISDWLVGRDPVEASEEIARLSEAAPEWKPHAKPRNSHSFEQATDDRYSLALPDIGVVFEVDRIRREHHELIGELCVRCDLPGARTYDGTLSIADFNLSSARARTERARLLAQRSNTEELDWSGFLEEFCQRVLAAERKGQPAVDLRELERPGTDDAIHVEGISLPRRHPTIIFGDGGAAKSYTALYLAGRLVQQGFVVGLFDWELAGEDHRDRLERLFGQAMPGICYARCERPLVYEVDRLSRIVREQGVTFAFFDSIAFACDGPPESAETASRYFRAVRQVGVGSLHIAHITKSEGGEEKPFGSVFWHNGARATWYAKLVDDSSDGDTLSIGLYNRKANLGRLRSPAGFTISFTECQTSFKRSNPADNPELAGKMSVRQRMIHVLRSGALSPEEIAEQIDAEPETIGRTVRRHKSVFTLLQGGKVALLQRVG